MSWKSIVITGLLCVVASPVLAAPTLSIDLVRDGSNLPVLTSGGDWQWVVSVSPDTALFADNPPNGIGGSVAVELAFEATGSDLISVTKNATNFPNDNPGTAIATYPIGDGVQVSGNKAVASLGSTYFLQGGPAAYEMLTIVTDGPSTVGSLTSTLSWLGAYSGNGRIAQAGVNNDTFVGSLTKTVLGGDANLNGSVNIGDFGVLQANFNGTSKIWTQGDFNGTGSVNIGDFGILQANFNGSLPAPGGGSLSAVPEPTTAMLLLFAACTAVGLRRNRS